MQEASKDEMLVKEVGWAGNDYTDLLNLQLMKFHLKGGMIADNIWGNGEILDNPDFRKGLRRDLNSDLFLTGLDRERGLYAKQIIQLRQK